MKDSLLRNLACPDTYQALQKAIKDADGEACLAILQEASLFPEYKEGDEVRVKGRWPADFPVHLQWNMGMSRSIGHKAKVLKVHECESEHRKHYYLDTGFWYYGEALERV